jgi:biopolymer transport protein ExbB
VVRFPGQKVTLSGELVDAELLRIGLFNLASEGDYLNFVPETGRATELSRQPERYLHSTLASVGNLSTGQAVSPELIAIDPTRGQLLSMLIQLPDAGEKIKQGGYIGYAIIALGLVALLIFLERLISLTLISRRVEKQLRSETPLEGNPLGRLLRTFDEFRDRDLETVELKLGERMLREVPKLNARLLIIKVITVITPLMGLLGTVTGLIFTFQSITLFGTGDPKLMAGGISQALMTTVLGLSVAIPGLLLHTIASSKAKTLSQVLEQQAAGLIAQRALNQ